MQVLDGFVGVKSRQETKFAFPRSFIIGVYT